MLVEKKSFTVSDFALELGAVLKTMTIGYETYGRLNADTSNAILVAHYFTGTSHAAARYSSSDAEPGYWDSIIGPGKAIDTDRYFVLSCDSLCNLNTKNPYVITTGPASLNPETGKPYGASFPTVTIGDFVNAQNLVCESLGIKKLVAVCGPSMGAFQSLEWAARYPEKVERVIAAISPGLSVDAFLVARLNTWCAPILLDAQFKDGNYHENEGPVRGLTQALKLVTLDAVHFGWAKRLFSRRLVEPSNKATSPFAIEQALEATALARAEIGDANSFLRIARAVQLFSIEERKHLLKAKFLFLPADSDLLMYMDFTENAARELTELGLSAEVSVIEGDGGHLDGLTSIFQTTQTICRFLES